MQSGPGISELCATGFNSLFASLSGRGCPHDQIHISMTTEDRKEVAVRVTEQKWCPPDDNIWCGPNKFPVTRQGVLDLHGACDIPEVCPPPPRPQHTRNLRWKGGRNGPLPSLLPLGSLPLDPWTLMGSSGGTPSTIGTVPVKGSGPQAQACPGRVKRRLSPTPTALHQGAWVVMFMVNKDESTRVPRQAFHVWVLCKAQARAQLRGPHTWG